jgi:hypothetical protein
MIASPAIATAQAAALAGETSAQIGYILTTKALAEETAIAVFPLLLLEATAILDSLAAYAATQPAWAAATATVTQSASSAATYWD